MHEAGENIALIDVMLHALHLRHLLLHRYFQCIMMKHKNKLFGQHAHPYVFTEKRPWKHL
jgi:hypothetical protein